MKILVIGATGFVGNTLLKELVDRKYEVKALLYEQQPVTLSREIIKKIEWVKADLNDIASLSKIISNTSTIYHCMNSSFFIPTPYQKAYKTLLVQGLANIVNIALESKHINKMVYLSSAATLFATDDNDLTIETLSMPSKKIQLMDTLLKWEAEKQIYRGMEEGLPAIIINPSYILGVSPYWYSQEALLFNMVYQGMLKKNCPGGITGFVTLHDLVKAMILLMESPIKNKRFIINAANMSYQEIVTHIAQAFHKPIPQNTSTPSDIFRLLIKSKIAKLLTKNHYALNRSLMDIMQQKNKYNNKKFLEYFKDFEYESIQNSIPLMCETYKHNFNLK